MVKVAIAHDYLTQRGGAERVVLDLLAAFPDAPLYTSLYAPEQTYPEFASVDIRTTTLNRVGLFRRHHRTAFPLLAPAFGRLHIDADVVVCQSTGWAHGVQTNGTKVVYCNNPARWLYQPDDYGVPRAARPFAAPLMAWLKRWDQQAARTVDAYIANSNNVADRIKRVYGRDSKVIYPAAGLPQGPLQRPTGVDDRFMLCVCRLLSYKNVGAVIRGVNQVEGVQLVIVGAGPDEAELRTEALGTDTLFLSGISDDEMRWLYQNCQAAISASHEDFGLMPVEAATMGRPSVVLRRGGFVETVRESVTGEFFDTPAEHEIAAAVGRALRRQWDQQVLYEHAQLFSRSRFVDQVRNVVGDVAEA